jgi:sec-independent protein translocase protein TatB
MLFNVGGYEILVIAVIALIFVGPEQLPTVLRKVGRYAAQMRGMAQGIRDEFMAGLDDVPDDLKDLTKLKDLTSLDSWLGSGTDADPIVPRGFAERQQRTQAALAAAAAQDAAEGVPVNTAMADQSPADLGLSLTVPVAEQGQAHVEAEPVLAVDADPMVELAADDIRAAGVGSGDLGAAPGAEDPDAAPGDAQR